MEKRTNRVDAAILEEGAAIVCRDFEAFCEYLVEQKAKLSKTTGHIGKKDCFELNRLLHVKEDEKATRFQNQYPVINFFYYAALKYKILERNPSGCFLICGRNYQLYQQASVCLARRA